MARSLSLSAVRQGLEAEQRCNALQLIALRSLFMDGRCNQPLRQRLEHQRQYLESRQRELERIRDLLRCTNQ